VNISANLSASVTDFEWTTTLSINLSAPFFLVRAVLPNMIKKGFGRIINIGSIYSTRVVEKNLPYSVSKHGLSALTKTVAREYGKYGITCNEICPGPVNSRLMDEIAERNAAVLHISSDEYLHRIADSIPVPRLAQPTDIAEAALFLASEKAGYLNELSLTLDGGLTT
jgi:NAD(P)-dependent dehydrogenase (short-subunit alcohol dehydrogenase family)